MNYRNLFRTVSIFIFVFASFRMEAQTVSSIYAGTKTPYLEPGPDHTAPPKNYKPVFVNYVGRHGARFMTKSGADKQALDLLEQADKEHTLTYEGQLIKRSVQKMLMIQQTGYEKITKLGAQEQTDIGKRIYDHYKSAFSGRGIRVQYTFKIRTQQSANAFLSAYQKYKGGIRVDKNTDAANTALRFYDLSPFYTSYKEGPEIRRSLDSLNADPRNGEVVKQVCFKLFTRSFAEQLVSDGRASRFVENLYDLYAAEFAVVDEMKSRGFTADSINLRMAFSETSLEWLDFKSGAADFLEKGPGRNAAGIQVTVAVPLLIDFLNTTDSAITNKDADARFRFTHAEAISPFATLLAISLASKPSSTIFGYADHWKTEEIIPLSANIQWILYSDGNRYLIKVLLNEREIRLPIRSATAPYYDWNDFRKFYLEKLSAIHVNPDMDMLGYLKTLQ